MLTAFVALGLAAAGTPMQVEISSPKTRLFPYEPVKISIRATASQPLHVPAVLDTSGVPITEVWIDYGAGFVLYSDDSREHIEGGGVELSIDTGQRLVFTLVLIEGRLGSAPAVPFPSPGRRSLRVRLRSGRVILGESSPLTFEAVRPDAEGERLLSSVQVDPWIMRAQAGLQDATCVTLLNQFPESPYLQWGKRQIAVQKATRIGNGQYPDSGEPFAEIGQGSELAKTLYRELATDLLSAASWGPFDEERFGLAALNLERGGAAEEARLIWRQIAERFPGSEAAEQAKSRIDSTPPSLQVAASPSFLWPPNHKLGAISVAVSVTDDTDASPSVKLVSVACDDDGKINLKPKPTLRACDPADIEGAAYGTDDREFALRAERLGTGPGRVYEITYSARDAAGNEATATTTVSIAHDEGKKK